MRAGISQRGATTFNRDPFLTLNRNFDTDEDNSTSSSIIVTRPPKGFEEREEEDSPFSMSLRHSREKSESGYPGLFRRIISTFLWFFSITWVRQEQIINFDCFMIGAQLCYLGCILYRTLKNFEAENWLESEDLAAIEDFESTLIFRDLILNDEICLPLFRTHGVAKGLVNSGALRGRMHMIQTRGRKSEGKKEAMKNGDDYAAVYKPDREREINNAGEDSRKGRRSTEHRPASCSIRRHRKNDDVYSYVVGVGSVMGYWVTFDQALLRGIPKGGIVSQEEVEIHLGLERNFSA
ncbi:hypothetical protein ALC60_00159 [Trachymyrmex zeteki]|uniref:Uncharacterized protein n=1 Tax=Mycetomoellerius zeteki TaxID=64791 RepID=A0A151XKS1_9HYME|nr:hypothetical protein ALC60_00159 [Trachymyrmex zeteki]